MTTTVAEKRPAVGRPGEHRDPPTVIEGEERLPRWVRRTGWTLLGLQLVAMVAFSTLQYSRYGLGNDFADYSQAWWAIGHGNLDPFSSGFGISFWRDNAEFIMWPLALLRFIDPHPVVLLWVQDLAVVLTELVAFTWILRVVERQTSRITHAARCLLAVGAAVVLVVNPWVYETVAYDFHFEPIAALFCVLAAFDLWSGRTRRLWVWVGLALLSHVLAGTYLVGIGLSGLVAGRATRRTGALVAAAGAVWVVVFNAVGAAGVKGEFVSSSYGYLVGPHRGRVGVGAVVLGALEHPAAVAHVAGSHWTVVTSFVLVVGVIGLFSPWGLGMAVVVLVPNVLDASGLFIRYGASFQSWPAMSFLVVGSIMVLVRLLQGGGVAHRVAVLSVAVWGSLLAVFGYLALPTIPAAWLYVTSASVTELARVQTVIPANAEVIVSLPVVGRFAQRDSAYAFVRPGETFPVDRKLVVFVLGPHEDFDTPVSQAALNQASGFVHNHLHAPVLSAGADVRAYSWSPPPGTRRITLP